jgi:transcriptional regulator with XRE-family HTH domain
MARRRDHELLAALGARLREVRTARGFTQERLADAIGVRTATISRFETGQVGFSITTLADLADVLGVGVATLVDADLVHEETQDPVLLQLLALPNGVRTRAAALALALVRGAASVPEAALALRLDDRDAEPSTLP